MLLTTRYRTSPRINRFDVLRGIHLAETLSRVALKLGISRVLATPPLPEPAVPAQPSGCVPRHLSRLSGRSDRKSVV